ncbi:hypothetical protein [Rhodococcus sp. NPDC047139]|uniref:hypothetical protein n=1 Tax=Rhodococcus sp. NPDC047139 TaxID=3155141 RepID=UPI0033E01761
MKLEVGRSWASTVDRTAVVVVRAPEREVALTCGGAGMVPGKKGTGEGAAITNAHLGPTALGKRYTDADGTVELLCTTPGTGVLAVDGVPLSLKAAKPLPASD